MEQSPAAVQQGTPNPSLVPPATSASDAAAATVEPQACASCGTAPSSNPGTPPAHAPATALSWVYAIGRIDLVPPSMSWEKELAQAVGRADETKDLTDSQTLYNVLSKPENAYLARQACWVLKIAGLETYILAPRYQHDFSLLVAALGQDRKPSRFDIVIGAKGPIAPSQMCNGLMLPIVMFDQLYYSDRESLIETMGKPEKVDQGLFKKASQELFERIMLMTDNTGATNYNRAPNYLSVRYKHMYEAVAQAFARDESLTNLDVRRSPLSGAREVVDVIFSFTNRQTDVVNKHFVRVDVTDEFPFLVSKWSPYFDR